MPCDPWVDGKTIGQVLSATARQFPDRDAIVFCRSGVRWSWQQFDERVNEVARGLLALGMQRGDHFGLWATNRPEWVLLQFATARIGVVLVTINPAYQSAELEYTLAQSEVRGLALIAQFKSSNYDDILSRLCPEIAAPRHGRLHCQRLPDLESLIRIGDLPHPGMLPWDELCSMGAQVPQTAWEAATRMPRPEDPINLQYTSGTTGKPKGALLTHRNLLLNAFYAGHRQRLDEMDRICLPVPLYHCFGCVLGSLAAAIRGCAMVFPGESFQPAETLAAIETQRCTSVYGVPTMFLAMLEHEDFPRRNVASLRTGIMAGSPCPIELMKRVTSQMGVAEITIGYGQTEASPLITMTQPDDPLQKRVGTVGRVLPGVEAKIVSPGTGAQVEDGVPGELCTRGHNVMLGYYNQPEATADAIDENGWLHTGDLAIRESDGYFRITGRLKDMIIRGGENISPREIEELLYRHPAVEDVQVVGVPDVRLGEEIVACIRRRPNAELEEEDVRQFCRRRLAYFKVPCYVWFVETYPTTITGKIQKFKLRQWAIRHFGLEDADGMQTA